MHDIHMDAATNDTSFGLRTQIIVNYCVVRMVAPAAMAYFPSCVCLQMRMQMKLQHGRIRAGCPSLKLKLSFLYQHRLSSTSSELVVIHVLEARIGL